MAVKMLPKKMAGAILPGNSSVEMKEFDVPKPGHGQVFIQTKATTICGSDIRCIYREHVGKGPEGYIPGMVQSAAAIHAINAGFIYIPAVLAVLWLIVISFYDLDKKYPTIIKELEERRSAQ